MPGEGGAVWTFDWLTPLPCRILFALVLTFGVVSHLRYLNHNCPIDLSGDEAQYWDWSRQLDLSYYSKGPLVACIIRASCELFGNNMPAVRYPAILLGAGTSLLTYLLTRKLFDSDRLALGTVLLYHIVPMFVAGSVLMTIDPPFFFCWALATYLLAHAVFDDRRWVWPLIGLVVGVGFLAKYAMMLWFLPMVLLLATDREARRQLRSAGPWGAIAVALACTTPVIVWNARHGWVSVMHVATQTGTSTTSRFHPGYVLEFLGGQFGVMGPGLFVILAFAAVYAMKPWGPRPEPRRRELRFLGWIGLAFFALTMLASLRAKVQINWPAPAYFTLMIATAYFLATRLQDRERWKAWRWWFYPAAAFGLLVMPIAHDVEIVYPAINWLNHKTASWRQEAKANGSHGFKGWLAKRMPKSGLSARQVDFTAKLKGWRELGARFGDELETLGPGAFILCEDYQQTAELAFYTPGQPKTFYAGSHYAIDPKRMTQYDVWPDRRLQPPNERIGKNAIFLGHTNRTFGELLAAFDRVEGVPDPKGGERAWAIELKVERGGVEVQTFRYFRCYGFRGMTPNWKAH